TVLGGTANDTFNVAPSPTTAMTINGGPETSIPPGDTLNLDLTGTTNPALSVTGPGSGVWTFGNRASVTYSSIETLNENGTFNLLLNMANSQTGQHDYIDTQLDLSQTNFQVRVDPPLPAGNLIFNGSFASINSFRVVGDSAPGGDTETLLVDGVHG